MRDFQGSLITSDDGLVLVRELDNTLVFYEIGDNGASAEGKRKAEQESAQKKALSN